MNTYRVSGYLYMESTGDEAKYDVDIEFDDEPNEMDVLNALLSTGDIQIFHESTKLVDGVE